MVKSLSLLISIFLLSSCAWNSVSKEDRELAQLHLKVGTGYFKAGKYPQALQELLIAERLDPKNFYVLNNLGLTYYVRDNKNTAINKLKKALAINPKYSDARNNLGRILIDQKKYNEALGHLKIVNSDLLYRHPERSWTNTGLAYFNQKKYKEAKQALNKALKLRRQYCPAHTIFGRILFEEARYDEAAQSLDQASAVCIKQNYDEANYYSGLSYIKIGQKDKARARLEEILVKFPNGNFAEKAKSTLNLIQ